MKTLNGRKVTVLQGNSGVLCLKILTPQYCQCNRHRVYSEISSIQPHPVQRLSPGIEQT